MSRRQSRVSSDVRQNDTLLEFENFKKKFLLANKHITKLNSTLSVRIEELNAQISTLYVENLRLRASEIALASQLKKEREKSRKIMADTEAATHSLIQHLGHLRKSFNLSHGHSNTSSPQAASPPRARRPPPKNPNASPPVNRIARPPNFPGIHEDDESNLSSPDSPDGEQHLEEDLSPTPTLRRKAKPRSSSSRLPLPTRVSSPPPIPEIDFGDQLGKAGKRKPTRRQSGLLATSVSITTVTPTGFTTEIVPPRPPSPAYGSPLRRDAGLEEEEEEVLAAISEPAGQEDDDLDVAAQTVIRREKKKKSREKEKEKEKEREREGEREGERESTSSGESLRRERERKRTREAEACVGPADGKKSKLQDVTNSPPNHSALPPLNTIAARGDRDRQHTPDTDIPTSAVSMLTSASHTTTRTFLTTPATTPAPTPKPTVDTYLLTPRTSSPPPPPPPADPDPPAGGRERRVRKSVNYAEPKLNTKMRKPDPAPSTSKRASTSGVTDTPAPRTSIDTPTIQTSSSSSSVENTATQPLAGVKRKKSRPYIIEDEESEGAQADAEYSSRHGSGWVNLEGRRRSVHTGAGGSMRRLEGDDSRRHSMAI